MTASANRPCPTPGCPNLITVYAKRCPSCALAHARQRAYEYRRRQLDRIAATKGAPRCKICGRAVGGRNQTNRTCSYCRSAARQAKEIMEKDDSPAQPTGIPVRYELWGRLSWDDYVMGRKEAAEVEA